MSRPDESLAGFLYAMDEHAVDLPAPPNGKVCLGAT